MPPLLLYKYMPVFVCVCKWVCICQAVRQDLNTICGECDYGCFNFPFILVAIIFKALLNISREIMLFLKCAQYVQPSYTTTWPQQSFVDMRREINSLQDFSFPCTLPALCPGDCPVPPSEARVNWHWPHDIGLGPWFLLFSGMWAGVPLAYGTWHMAQTCIPNLQLRIIQPTYKSVGNTWLLLYVTQRLELFVLYPKLTNAVGLKCCMYSDQSRECLWYLRKVWLDWNQKKAENQNI